MQTEYINIVVTVIAIVSQYVWDTGLPFWGDFITLALAAIYVIPVGIVYAVANLNSNNLTGLGGLISGYLLPGKPFILLIFKVCYSRTFVTVGSSFSPFSFMHTPESARLWYTVQI